MNIVKIINGTPPPLEGPFKGTYRQWGLGENGNLYHRIGDADWVGDWKEYNGEISWHEMKLIVKEFAHLVIFT